MPTNVENQVLTSCGGVKLRSEAVSHDGTAHEWGKVCVEFQKYLRKNTGDPDHWNSHAYSKKAADDTYGKIRGGARWLKENTSDQIPITTLLLTVVGWERDDDNEPAPPYDYLSDLIDGRSAVIDQLDKLLSDQEYGYVWVIEPHGDKNGRRLGYPHVHIGVFVRSDSVEGITEKLLEKSDYYEENAFSRRTDHDDKAVSISQPDDPHDPVDLAKELTNDLIGHGLDGLDLTRDFSRKIDDSGVRRHVRLGSLLWAGGKPQVIRNKYFNECIEKSEKPEEYDGESSGTVEIPDVDPDKDSTQSFITTQSVGVKYEYPSRFE